VSAWRRRREAESAPVGDGPTDEPELVEDITMPDLFADRAAEPSLAEQEWAAEPEPPRAAAVPTNEGFEPPAQRSEFEPHDEAFEQPVEETAVVPALGEDTTVMETPVAEEPTTALGEPVAVEPPRSRAAWLRDVRITSMSLYVVAFLLLLGAATAVGVAQFTASTKAPWVSVGLSGAAVAFTMAAIMVRSWP
jgi:hypothetical protein